MSKMIPQRSIDVFREFVDISLDIYGISCDLYIPNNLDTTETYDIYQKPADYEYDHYTSKVFIEWSPNIYRLKAMGLFVEGELPIICYFGNKATNDSEDEVDVDILRHSYFSIEPQYIPDLYTGFDEFELIDVMIKGMHDAVLVKSWKAVPRRYETTS